VSPRFCKHFIAHFSLRKPLKPHFLTGAVMSVYLMYVERSIRVEHKPQGPVCVKCAFGSAASNELRVSKVVNLYIFLSLSLRY